MKARSRRSALLMLVLAWTTPGAWAASLARAPDHDQHVVCPRPAGVDRMDGSRSHAPHVTDTPMPSRADVGVGDVPAIECAAPPAAKPVVDEPSAPAPNWRRLLPGLLK